MTTSTAYATAVRHIEWLNPIQDELSLLEKKMAESSEMGHDALDKAIMLIVQAGGKRLRPAISILVGRLLDAAIAPVISVAASVELLHTATLVHDDLIDGAAQRRGVPTLHSTLPAGITVLSGDFLFAKSAALAAEANNVQVVQLFAETLVRICKGEILQAQTRWQIPSYDTYIERIYGKTAALFEAAARSSAILGGLSADGIAAFGRYGKALGLAFQIVDDALDFGSSSVDLGKPTGHDMTQGHFNLPAMYFVEQNHISADTLIREVREGSRTAELVEEMRHACVVEKAMDAARDYARTAESIIDTMPAGVFTESLRQLTRYAVARDY